MNWNEYLTLSEKTLSTEFHCEDQKWKNILHATLGILSEIEETLENYEQGELVTDVTKQGSLSEEVADISWYVAILFRELNLEKDGLQLEIHHGSGYETILNILTTSLRLVDPLKKKIYYNKSIDESSISSITKNILSLLIYYCDLNGINFSESLDRNISKLKARYGEKFSSDRAVNRNLENEKNILEN